MIPNFPPSLRAGSPASGPSTIEAWRRDAALCLGASPPVAHHFGETGLIVLDGKTLSLQPLGERPAGAWIASARAARPAGVDEAEWCDAVLLASSQSLMVTHAAFGLAADGDAVLILLTPAGLGDPALLGAEVVGLLALRNALLEGVGARGPQAPRDRAPDGPVDASGGEPAAQPFEAPEEVQVLVHGAMLHLGRSAAQALAASRSGGIDIDGRRISLSCDIDGENLVLATDLGAGVLDTASQRHAAALANPELMALVGMAVVREHGRARLMTRWHLPGQSAENLAGWLGDVAHLASAIVECHTARARH
jgi:hypothetical protein